MPLDPDYDERAIYTVSGEIEIAGDVFPPGAPGVPAGRPHYHPGQEHARFMMLGGEPMDGPRYIWWNFVSSRRTASTRPRPTGSRPGSIPSRYSEVVPADRTRGASLQFANLLKRC